MHDREDSPPPCARKQVRSPRNRVPSQPTGESLRILVVDHDGSQYAIVERMLVENGHTLTVASSAADAAVFLKQEHHDVLITDLGTPGSDRFELMREVRDNHPDTGVIAMSSHPAIEGARLAVLANLRKPHDLDDPQPAAGNADTTARAQRADAWRASRGGDGHAVRSGLIGESAPMLQVFRMIETIGSTDATVLLLGETGTGKEGVARAIHQASRRSSGPFVPVNCAAISKELAESLLFGHKRGSFTGAKTDHRGYFAQAHGGTILLDEIGEMPIELQAKLLRVLDDKAVRPVGSEREEPVDVRVIAATNRALAEALDGGGFRRDLYYRLCLARIDIPPLRDRGTDILLLSSHFLDAYARRYGRPCPRLTGDAADTLLRYDWPGNVRELKHIAANLILTCNHDPIDDSDLPEEFRDHALAEESLQLTLTLTLPLDLTLDEATRAVRLAHAERVLASVGGNHRKAATKLDVATRTLRRVLGEDDEHEAEA